LSLRAAASRCHTHAPYIKRFRSVCPAKFNGKPELLRKTIYPESPYNWLDRPERFMDPLSDVLMLVKPHTYRAGGFDLGGDFAIEFPKHESIKCYAVVSGQCWLSVEGVPEGVRLTAGDCFLLPRGLASLLASDLTLTPADARTVFPFPLNGRIASCNGGGDCLLVGGNFTLTGKQADLLLAELPPIVHIRKESDKAAMRWPLERMREELRDPQPGGFLVIQQLACMMLVQALRLHLAEGLKGRVGWLFALSDKQISAAITSMHNEPAHDWTVEELARRGGMSRSTFALRFHQMVGVSPIEYLTRWRMLLAGDRMTNTNDSISEIAQSLGYESASAFTKAFKKIMGCSPRQYITGQNPVSRAYSRANPSAPFDSNL
jgi:AraC-like DNA-binding protein